jgi:proteic killer suppression protein
MAIASFGDTSTEDVFHGQNTKQARKLPKQLWDVIRRKLDLVNAAQSLQDLRVPPANRLEEMRHRPGFHSIRVNDQYRVVFRFVDGTATDVTCEDYH